MSVNVRFCRPQQTENQEQTTQINKRTILNDLIMCMLYSVWLSYYVPAWQNLDGSRKTEYTSQLLFGYMLVVAWALYNNCKKLVIDWQLLGTEMLTKVYEHKLMFSSKYYKALHGLLDFASEIIMMCLVSQFIPFTQANKHSYSYTLWTSGRVGALFGIIMIIFSCIFGFGVLVTLLFLCCHPELLRNVTFRLYVSQAQRNPILSQFSLFRHLDIFDEECPICMQSGAESGDSNFVELGCHHKFHDNCARQWIATGTNLNCPTCRAPIDASHLSSQTSTNVPVSIVVPSAPPIQTTYQAPQPTQLKSVEPSVPPYEKTADGWSNMA